MNIHVSTGSPTITIRTHESQSRTTKNSHWNHLLACGNVIIFSYFWFWTEWGIVLTTNGLSCILISINFIIAISQLSVDSKLLHGFPCRSNVVVWYVKWWFILCHLLIATGTGRGMNWKTTTKQRLFLHSVRWWFVIVFLEIYNLHGACHSHWSLNGPRSLELMWFVVGNHAVCRIRWFSTHTHTWTTALYNVFRYVRVVADHTCSISSTMPNVQQKAHRFSTFFVWKFFFTKCDRVRLCIAHAHKRAMANSIQNH